MDDFKFITELGKGEFGSVSLYSHQLTNFHFAVKSLNKSDVSLSMIKKEQRILEKMQNSLNVVFLHQTIEDSKRIHFILEYCRDGEITNYIMNNQSLPKKQKISMITDIVRAVRELHSKNIIHRDLKPSNFLVTQGIVKLADFGISKKLEPYSDLTLCGTPLYMAPEMFETNRYTSKIDIWSLGIVSYEILKEKHPFEANNLEDLLRNMHSKIDLEDLTEDEVDFFSISLQVKPNLRACSDRLSKSKIIRKFIEPIHNGLEDLLKLTNEIKNNAICMKARFLMQFFLINDILYLGNKDQHKINLKTSFQDIGISNINEEYFKQILDNTLEFSSFIGSWNVSMSSYLLYAHKRLKNIKFISCFNSILQ